MRVRCPTIRIVKANVEVLAKVRDVLGDVVEFVVAVDDDEICAEPRALLSRFGPRALDRELPIARGGEVLPSDRTLS